jgi:predicted nucleotidyltransferase
LLTDNSQKRPSLHLDYFCDYKDRICQVLSWHHPENKRICIVKYEPGKGFWVSRETGMQYKRILESYSLEGHQKNLNYIKNIEPSYLYHSEVYGVDFLAAPITKIKRYYYPEERLAKLLSLGEKDLDWIELRVKKLAQFIQQEIKIPYEKMGISGSILWQGQTEKSDIDFIIYGNDNSRLFNEKYSRIYEVTQEIEPLPDQKKERYVRSMAKKTGLPESVTEKYISRKKWLSIYGKTSLSFLFSPEPNERPFQYGEQLFRALKPVTISAKISSSDLGFAYPSIYQLSNCEFLNDKEASINLPIKRVFSFEGALTGYFKANDKIVIRGLLEEVNDLKKEKKFYQILLGTKECVGNEFILYEEDYRQLPKNYKNE